MLAGFVTFKQGSVSMAASRVTCDKPHMGGRAPPWAQFKFRKAFYYEKGFLLSPHPIPHQTDQVGAIKSSKELTPGMHKIRELHTVSLHSSPNKPGRD